MLQRLISVPIKRNLVRKSKRVFSDVALVSKNEYLGKEEISNRVLAMSLEKRLIVPEWFALSKNISADAMLDEIDVIDLEEALEKEFAIDFAISDMRTFQVCENSYFHQLMTLDHAISSTILGDCRFYRSKSSS